MEVETVLLVLLPAFILLMGAIIVAGAFIVAPNAGAEMERRINLVAAPLSGKAVASITSAAQKRQGPTFDARVRSIFAIGAKHHWGMHSRAVNLLLIGGICGLAVSQFLAHAAGFAWWPAAAAGAFAAFFLPRTLLLRQQRAQENRFVDLFPDAIDTIVRMLRAGLPMTSAVRIVGDDGAPPVSAAFSMIADQVRIGIPIEQALDASSRHFGLADFRFFAVAVLLQYSAGGNIAATLDMLSGIIRKRRAVRMKAKSATAEIRMTGYLLGSLPFFVVGILLLIQPRYLDPLFADARGHLILAMAAGGLMLSFFTMRQMMRGVVKG
jgi:tight adherence protein B